MIKVEEFVKIKEEEIDLDGAEFDKYVKSTKTENVYRKHVCVFRTGGEVEMLAADGRLYAATPAPREVKKC